MLMVKSVISKLLYHYKLLPGVPGEDVEMLMEIMLKPANGIKLKLRRR